MNDSFEARAYPGRVHREGEGGLREAGYRGRQGSIKEEQAGSPTIIVQPDRQDVGKHWVKSLFQVGFQNVTLFKTAFN